MRQTPRFTRSSVVPPRRCARHTVARLATAALLVLGLAGCENVASDPTSVVVRYAERAPLTRDRLVVTVSAGGRRWYFEGEDLTPDGTGWLASRPLRVGDAGTVEVTAAFRGDQLSPAGIGAVQLPLERDGHWQVDVLTSALEPSTVCAGCTGVTRFSIAEAERPAAHDWLYIRWTGTPATTTGVP